MHLGNPVLRAHYGNGFAKQYVRDDRLLRTELATNNVFDYGVNKAVENLPQLRERATAIIDRYLDAQQDILETFVDRGQLRRLSQPTATKKGRRIPGLKLDHSRQLALMQALVRFAHLAAGGPSPPVSFTLKSPRPWAWRRPSTSSPPCATSSPNCGPKAWWRKSLTPTVIAC